MSPGFDSSAANPFRDAAPNFVVVVVFVVVFVVVVATVTVEKLPKSAVIYWGF